MSLGEFGERLGELEEALLHADAGPDVHNEGFWSVPLHKN
jgi:hypothetical protein